MEMRNLLFALLLLPLIGFLCEGCGTSDFGLFVGRNDIRRRIRNVSAGAIPVACKSAVMTVPPCLPIRRDGLPTMMVMALSAWIRLMEEWNV